MAYLRETENPHGIFTGLGILENQTCKVLNGIGRWDGRNPPNWQCDTVKDRTTDNPIPRHVPC